MYTLSLHDALPILPPAASVLKKFVRLASTFPSPPFGSSDIAGPRRPRLYGFHTHSEPFESEGTRAAKRYVNGNLGFRNLLGARRRHRGQFSVQSDYYFFCPRGRGCTLFPYTTLFRSCHPLRRCLKNL